MAIIDQIQVNETTYDIRDNSAQPKESGKGLSTNDFTDAYKNQLDGLSTELDTLQPKESGKGLSTNDFTDSYKDQLDNLDSSLATFQPKVSGKDLSTNDFTDAYKNELDQIYVARVHSTQGSAVKAALAAGKQVIAGDAVGHLYSFSRVWTAPNNVENYEFTRVENKKILYYTVSESSSNWTQTSRTILLVDDASLPASKITATSSSGSITFYDIDTEPSDSSTAFVTSSGIKTALDNYAKKVSVQGLSTAVSNVQDTLLTLQPKESGKGLSANDFTDSYKDRLDDLDSSLAALQPKESGKGLSTNDFTDVYKEKLDGFTLSDIQNLSDQIAALRLLVSYAQSGNVPNPTVENNVLYFFGEQAAINSNDYLSIASAQVDADIITI